MHGNAKTAIRQLTRRYRLDNKVPSPLAVYNRNAFNDAVQFGKAMLADMGSMGLNSVVIHWPELRATKGWVRSRLEVTPDTAEKAA